MVDYSSYLYAYCEVRGENIIAHDIQENKKYQHTPEKETRARVIGLTAAHKERYNPKNENKIINNTLENEIQSSRPIHFCNGINAASTAGRTSSMLYS